MLLHALSLGKAGTRVLATPVENLAGQSHRMLPTVTSVAQRFSIVQHTQARKQQSVSQIRQNLIAFDHPVMKPQVAGVEL